jgi:hypothetical protein
VAQDKNLKKAIKEGRQFCHFYEVNNDKEKYIELSKLQESCQSYKYIIGNYSIKEIGRFGDVANSVEHFEFIPVSEYGDYIFENISTITPSNMLKSKGSVYFFGWNQSAGTHFTRYNDVLWTGEVNNGFVNGRGEGFKQLSINTFLYFSGLFSNGIPTGETRFCTYNVNNKKYAYNKGSLGESKCMTGKISDGLCWFKYDNRYGYIDQNGQTVVKPVFQGAKDFSNGIAYVMEGPTEVKINKTGKVVAVSENAKMSFRDMVDMKKKHPDLTSSLEVLAAKYAKTGLTFIQLVEVERAFPNLKNTVLPYKTSIYQKDVKNLEGIYEKSKSDMNGYRYGEDDVRDFINTYGGYNFDPDGKLGIARELSDYHKASKAHRLSIDTSGSFVRISSFDGSPSYTESWDDDWNVLSDGLYVCDKGGQTAFSDYYASVKSKISSKRLNLNDKINRSIQEFNAAKKKYEAKQARIKNILDNINTSNIHKYVISEEWSRGRFIDSDDDFSDPCRVKFKDLNHLDDNWGDFEVTIYETYKRKNEIHNFSFSSGLFSSKYYSTYLDCLVGAFLYHYNRSWDKNMK